MIQATFSAKKMLAKVLESLPESEKSRFGRELRVHFDEIVTGTEIREFKILSADILKIVRDGGYNIPKSLI